MAEYFLRRADRSELGPLTASDLRALAHAGRLGPEDLIRKSGADEWHPAARVITAAIFAAVGFLIWYFAIRDTWEADHRWQIVRATEDIAAWLEAGEPEDAIREFDDLMRLTGERELRDSELQRLVAEAKRTIEDSKRSLAETESLRRLSALESKARALADEDDVGRAVQACEEAIDFVQESDTRNDEFDDVMQRLSELKRQLEAEEAKRAATQFLQLRQDFISRFQEAESAISAEMVRVVELNSRADGQRIEANVTTLRQLVGIWGTVESIATKAESDLAGQFAGIATMAETLSNVNAVQADLSGEQSILDQIHSVILSAQTEISNTEAIIQAAERALQAEAEQRKSSEWAETHFEEFAARFVGARAESGNPPSKCERWLSKPPKEGYRGDLPTNASQYP